MAPTDRVSVTARAITHLLLAAVVSPHSSVGRLGLLGLFLSTANAKCPRRCSVPGECRPPMCGPACCRYWERAHSLHAEEVEASSSILAAVRRRRNNSSCGNPSASSVSSRQLLLSRADDYPALTVLTNNSNYRVSDIIVHGGTRWRRDSIRVLTHPHYRDSALHEMLMHTSSVGGRPLALLPPRKLSAVMRTAARRDRALRGLLAPDGAGGIRLMASAKVRLRAFADIIRRRLDRRCCSAAPKGSVAVHLRLGDQLDAPTRRRNPFDPYGISESSRGFAALAQPIARYTCSPEGSFRLVVLVGVLNYSPHRKTFSFGMSNHSVLRSLAVAKNLQDALATCGVKYKWHTQANPDLDLCYFLTASYFVPSYGGFSGLVRQLRNDDNSSSAPQWSKCSDELYHCLHNAMTARTDGS
ncbi:hypothetical protein AB1Y20_021833 [Prymnesium parvum]|uniref:Peptide-O-fucosyltransferase 1 n=1 Tax=Prymnesium parvum TaxID=97485 RepID=A0AB34JJF5_PRYPA